MEKAPARAMWHWELSDVDRLCFHCPVEGGCNDKSPLCLLLQAEAERELERMNNGCRYMRSRILRLLRDNGPIGAGDIAEAIGATRKTVGKELWNLKRLYLVESWPGPGPVPEQAPHLYAFRVAIPLPAATGLPGTNGGSGGDS